MKRIEGMVDTVTPAIEKIQQPPILIYHKIDPRFEYSITRITPDRFAKQLDWLCDHGFRTVSLRDVIVAIKHKRPISPNAVVIAFDDGFESVYKYAYPLLSQRNLTGTIFIVAGYAGRDNDWDVNIGGRRFRHLSWGQIRRLHNNGMEIGSHSLNHPDLTSLPYEQARYELTASRELIQEKVGTPVDLLSCPFGKYSSSIASIAAESGYSGVVTVRNRPCMYAANGLITMPGSCVYLTTTFRSLRNKVEHRPPTWISSMVERGIGWCAGRTPLVKGQPEYTLKPPHRD